MIGASNHNNLGFRYTPPAPPGPSGLTLTVAGTGSTQQFGSYILVGGVDIIFDWGDGNSTTFAAGTEAYSIYHTYATSGNYDVEVTGSGRFNLMRIGNNLIDIKKWGTLFVPTETSAMFKNCNNVTCSATDAADFDTSSVTSMSGMFNNCNNFNGDISGFDTSNVTIMQLMFGNNYSFNQDLSNWNVSNVTNHFLFDTGTSSWQSNYKPSFP